MLWRFLSLSLLDALLLTMFFIQVSAHDLKKYLRSTHRRARCLSFAINPLGMVPRKPGAGKPCGIVPLQLCSWGLMIWLTCSTPPPTFALPAHRLESSTICIVILPHTAPRTLQ